MKKYYRVINLQVLITLFIALNLFATESDTAYVHPDSIALKNLVLKNEWKYQPGDDTGWAQAGYDDTDWDRLQSRFSYNEIPKYNWEGIGWFRTTFKIDSSLRFKPIAFKVDQFGASEFYLNGKLVKTLGVIADNTSEEENFQPRNIPFAVVLDSNIVYKIAVRYSNKISLEDPDWYTSWFNEIGFTLSLREIDDGILSLILNERANYGVNIGIAGIFFSLALLYFALFIFYSSKKENLYFALFNLNLSIAFLFSLLQRSVIVDLNLMVIYNIASTSTLVLVFPFYLGFLYSIFYEKLPKLFYYVCGFAVVIIFILILNLAEGSVNDIIILVTIFILTLEGLRVIIVAIKKDKPNSWIIGAGVIVFALFIITLFVFGILGLNLDNVVGIGIFFMGLFSLPVSMSVYLARDIASTNRDLQEQLNNVKELSEKELEHQKKAAELTLQAEKEKAAANEATLRAKIAEAESERKTKELEEARQLQMAMLPNELPKLPNLDIAVYMKTATEVGGDYYDFHVDIDGTLTVVIGDATGHGMKAGTMVTAAKSIFNSYVNNSDIIFTFQEFTRIIKMMKLHSMSMCLSLLKIRGNELEMSSAGMPHALLYRDSDSTVEEIALKGMPLGAFDDFPYKTISKKLNTGDSILLLSDGLPELFNSSKEMFGYERVTEEFAKLGSGSPDSIIKSLKTIAESWLDKGEPGDDITFVVIKVK